MRRYLLQPCPRYDATRWYPDKRAVSPTAWLWPSWAIYPLFTAPMGNMIIENSNVSIAFNIVGVFIVGFIMLSASSKMPAADFQARGLESAAESDTKRVKNATSGQDAEDPFFWTLLLFFGGTVACTGCVMLSTVSLVGRIQAGMDAATARSHGSIFAIANGHGPFGSLAPFPISWGVSNHVRAVAGDGGHPPVPVR